jgi:WD40 repeat protein
LFLLAGSSRKLPHTKGHSSAVYSVAFSGDSTRTASASLRDKIVKICDVSTGKCLYILEGHNSLINSVAFSRDSTLLALASNDKTVSIWDASSGKCLQTVEIGISRSDTSFDATGSHLHTEIGTIAINTSSASYATSIATQLVAPQYQRGELSSDERWIMYNSDNVVWLPPEYRPSCSAVLANVGIAVGTGSGKVLMYSFSTGNS